MPKPAMTDNLNAIRFISADGVQVANSGHPGLPMGAAAMAYAIWMRHMKHNPADPKWADRDRFVLSGGHGSMLLYTLLYLTGYGLKVEDLKQFRQWGSLTPGHPEYGHTPGIETTTGPLGQGFANAVGMAIAEAHLAAEFNRPGHDVVDHYTYAIVTDGDLMEGITSEAASLTGTMGLGKLIFLYDSNRISIEGSTEVAFTEDVAARFAAYNWHVQDVADGNDVEALSAAIDAAKADPRPSLSVCHTIIGYGLPTKAGSASVHGSPAGWEELNKAKVAVGWPEEPLFHAPEAVLKHFAEAKTAGQKAQTAWEKRFAAYAKAYPDLAAEFERRMAGKLPKGWKKALPVFKGDAKGMASRAASGKTINALAATLPELMGGSADLAPSNNTWMDGYEAFSGKNPLGRNIHFGVREMGMAGITNGMAVHGGLIPYCATFLVFSDYLRGALRVSALSKMGSVYVLTHDSIAVGEDGPTHEPIETVMSLRLIPDLVVMRPADANETAQAWRYAIEHRDTPVVLALSRQNLPTFDRSWVNSADGVQKGAYTLFQTKPGTPDLIIIATGSEVQLGLDAAMRLKRQGHIVRVVSMPSWEVFKAQSRSYRDEVLPPAVTARLSVEAGVTTGWQTWVGEAGASIGIDRFGASAPGDRVMSEFGFTVDKVLKQARKLLKK